MKPIFNALSGKFDYIEDDHTKLSNIGTNTHAQIDTALTVADAGGDTTTSVLLSPNATGVLSPKTDAGITYNASTNDLTVSGSVNVGTQLLGNPSDTVGVPSISWTGDTDTGFWRPGANSIAFSNGGVETLRLDAIGNVAIGTTTTAGRVFAVAGYQPENVATTPGTPADDLLVMSGGIGGTTTIATTGVGGVGAAFSFTGGVGGVASSATTSSTGGAGGEMTIVGGIGGAATTIGTTRRGGAGGTLNLVAGTGGSATGGTPTGGAGGNVLIKAGVGGTATTNGGGGVIVFYTSVGKAAQAERARIQNSYFGIGDTTPTNTFKVRGVDNSTTFMCGINAATASITAADTFIDFVNSTDVVLGGVNGTATAGLLAYATFTGSHFVQLQNESESIEVGMIIVATGGIMRGDNTEYLPLITKSTSRKQKTAFGVYAGKTTVPCEHKHDQIDITKFDDKGKEKVIGKKSLKCKKTKDNFRHTCEYEQGDNTKSLHQVYGLGTGVILVTNTNGNIEVGDYICSSTLAGYGEHQDDDILHNYSVAKATESVDWSKESKTTKIIACTYHCS